MMLAVPCWLRRFWETDNLFSCKLRIKRKKNAERASLSSYLSLLLAHRWIHLCISHMPGPILSGHSSYPCVQPHSDLFLALLSSRLAPFFFSSPFLVFLSHLTGLWAFFSTSGISHSNHSQSFIPPYSHLPFLHSLSLLLQAGFGYCARYVMVISQNSIDAVTAPVSMEVTLSAKILQKGKPVTDTYLYLSMWSESEDRSVTIEIHSREGSLCTANCHSERKSEIGEATREEEKQIRINR